MDQLMQSSYSAAINLARRCSPIKQELEPDEAPQPDVGFVDVDSVRVEPLELSHRLEQDVDPLTLPGTFQTTKTISQNIPSLPELHHFKQEVLDEMKKEPFEQLFLPFTSHEALGADQDVSSPSESQCLKQEPVEFQVKQQPPRLPSSVVDASEVCSAELQTYQGTSGEYNTALKSSVEGHKDTECDQKNPSTKEAWARDQSENETSPGNPQPECYPSNPCDSSLPGKDEHKAVHCDASEVGVPGIPRKRFHSGDKPYACDTCGAKFYQTCDLTRHMRSHSGDKPYACDICEARFTQSSHRTTHKRSHSGDRPFACDMCAARFTQGSNLRRHIQSHSGEKPHACDMCAARFTRHSHLAEHKKFHSGDKPHACDLCTARYTQKYYLTRHMKSHMEEKTHACDLCEARFAQNSNLTRHKRCHLGETSFVCHICQARFAKSAHLTRHKRSHFPQAKSRS